MSPRWVSAGFWNILQHSGKRMKYLFDLLLETHSTRAFCSSHILMSSSIVLCRTSCIVIVSGISNGTYLLTLKTGQRGKHRSRKHAAARNKKKMFPEKAFRIQPNNNHFMNNIKVNLAMGLCIHMLSMYDIRNVDALKHTYTVNNRLGPQSSAPP